MTKKLELILLFNLFLMVQATRCKMIINKIILPNKIALNSQAIKHWNKSFPVDNFLYKKLCKLNKVDILDHYFKSTY